MEYPIIIHGSENSLDVDAYIIVPKVLDFKEAKKFCDSYKDVNANLLYLENGQVAWSYKGTIDECNNSILATYSLHEQTSPNPIEAPMQRDYGLKMLRTLRGLLSYNSRTELRTQVKQALVSDDLDFRFDVLRQVDLTKVDDFQKSTITETYKFLAFQLGQTLALLQDNEELFTKNAVGAKYPQLQVYLDRQPSDAVALQQFMTQFIDFASTNYKKVEKQQLYVTNFFGHKEVLDCKKEAVLPPVVIFDIDGTLMDETHRAHLRESKKWREYFDACDKDTPIDHVVALTHEYREKGYEIWLMSGRGIECLDKTKQSMKDHGVEYDHIKLRSKNVFIPDYVLKPGWVSKYIGLDRVEAVYDDREKVIEGFSKLGLNVIDVLTLKQVGKKPKM